MESGLLVASYRNPEASSLQILCIAFVALVAFSVGGIASYLHNMVRACR